MKDSRTGESKKTKPMKLSPARETAYRILSDVFYQSAPLSTRLNESYEIHMSDSDRRLTSNIVYGAIKKRGSIDAALNKLAKSGSAKLDKRVKIILSIGLYQLLFLDRTPDYAVVSDAVEMARMFANESSASFVNAVLRNAVRRKDDLLIHEQPRLAKLYSETGFTRDAVDVLLRVYSEKEVFAYAHWALAPSKVYIRVNERKTDADKLTESLGRERVLLDDTYVPGLYEASGSLSALFASQAYREGHFFVQDLSGAISSWALGARKGEKILDVAVAPGAKSFGVYLASGGCQITGCDSSAERLAVTLQNAERLGVPLTVQRRDSTKTRKSFSGMFDRVIVDIPCTGLGVLGRKPDILLRFQPGDEKNLASLQREFMAAAFDAVRPGGVMLYSTCTLSREENEDNIEWFLSKEPLARREKVTLPFALASPHPEMENGMLRLFPPNDNCDGFFMALIRKESSL